jgi:hypothetical protein
MNESVESRLFTVKVSSLAGESTVVIPQDGAEPILTVNAKNISAPMEGTSGLLRVDSNCPWVVDPSELWIEVTPQSGEGDTSTEVLLKIAKNDTTSVRTGYLYFKSALTEEVLYTVKITQEKFVESLVINPSAVTFDAEGGTATITITSNTNWTIELI